MASVSTEVNVNVVNELNRIEAKVSKLMESSTALCKLVSDSVALNGDLTGYQRLIVDQLGRSATELTEIQRAIDQLN